MNYIIGIDIGGTHIDLVVVDDKQSIIKSHKQVHQKPLNDSIIQAIQKLIGQDLNPKYCQAIHIGTTIAINSLLEQKNLKKVGVLRLAAHQPDMPPAYHFPASLKEKILVDFVNVNAGFEYNKRAMGALSKHEVLDGLKKLCAQGAESIAVVGCFSPLYAEQELEVLNIIEEVANQKLSVCLSHQIGGLGFLNRENNTILNACLQGSLSAELLNLQKQIHQLGFTAPLFITQNNGCLMTLEEALEFPIKTIASGPTNSLIGACKLAGLNQAVIVDIGGTSTDIGVVENGFPRYSFESAKIAGIQTDYMLPEIQVLALGGGSQIKTQNTKIQIGPESLGADLFTQALTFGGNQLCLHDAAYVLQTQLPFLQLGVEKAEMIMAQLMETLQQQIDKIIQVKNYPILLVGGGAGLIVHHHLLPNMKRPMHFAVANAYGAALAEISATVDEVCSLAEHKQAIIEKLEGKAKSKAIQNGAKASSVRIIQKELLPFYYMENQLTRIIITASGPKETNTLVCS